MRTQHERDWIFFQSIVAIVYPLFVVVVAFICAAIADC